MRRRAGSGDNETGRDGFPSECPWQIDDVLSEGWLPANTSKLRYVGLRALAPDIDAMYIRVSGKNGARTLQFAGSSARVAPRINASLRSISGQVRGRNWPSH